MGQHVLFWSFPNCSMAECMNGGAKNTYFFGYISVFYCQ